ncbi:hypothetical protein GCM10023172_01580 [Hymenobacter ginsengisoli]|uniref:DUF3870 domain-containing protein n=1 Tax=Hymenobacter ginsengisoli TaxID=1051626 RepID=A0ABP8PW63_9BACT|nr:MULTISPECIES: hypothetical protein [unclassified Hymenobacter]MBO2033552.1 hypothetical protein [Hymenobacter sp. BT559]
MESSTRFLISVFLEDAHADPLVFIFQGSLVENVMFGVGVSRVDADAMEPGQLAEYLTDHYLKSYPREAERVGRDTILAAVTRAGKSRV